MKILLPPINEIPEFKTLQNYIIETYGMAWTLSIIAQICFDQADKYPLRFDWWESLGKDIDTLYFTSSERD